MQSLVDTAVCTQGTLRELEGVDQGVLGAVAKCLFDMRDFHRNTQSYCHSSISSLYQCHEPQKREYGDLIRELPSPSLC